MKQYLNKIAVAFVAMAVLLGLTSARGIDKKPKSEPEKITCHVNGTGVSLELNFVPGEAHNHPTFAVWIEDLNGVMVQPVFVTQAVATGVFSRGEKAPFLWDNQPGKAERPSALPYYFHKLEALKASAQPQNKLTDACSGATPKADFLINTQALRQLGSRFRVVVEVNQTWDWNEYWNNTLYPDEVNYKYSCQPALVYAVEVNTADLMAEYYLNPIGHSHYSGKDGNLYTNLSTITTAKFIFEEIRLTVK